MANDKNGKSVKAGDTVSVKFRVVASSVSTGDVISNMTIETIDNAGGHRPRLSLNSKLVELDESAPAPKPGSVEPTPGSTPKVIPNLEGGVNETPEPGDPRPGVLGKGGVASPPRGDNQGFREPSASIGDGILTGNPGVPDETLPEDQRDVEAHGGPGDVVAKGEADPIRQETDGRKVNVRDLSTPVNVRDDAPAGDATAATESFDAVKERATENIPREHVNTGDAEIDAAAKARGEREITEAPDALGNEKEHKNAEGNQPSSQSVASQKTGEAGTSEDEVEEDDEEEDEESEEDTVESLVSSNNAEELRAMAEELDIPTSGTKAEVAERILEARENAKSGGQS